jgi:hypothetical protein
MSVFFVAFQPLLNRGTFALFDYQTEAHDKYWGVFGQVTRFSDTWHQGRPLLRFSLTFTVSLQSQRLVPALTTHTMSGITFHTVPLQPTTSHLLLLLASWRPVLTFSMLTNANMTTRPSIFPDCWLMISPLTLQLA